MKTRVRIKNENKVLDGGKKGKGQKGEEKRQKDDWFSENFEERGYGRLIDSRTQHTA